MLVHLYHCLTGPREQSWYKVVTILSLYFFVSTMANTSIIISPRIMNAAQDEIVYFTCVSNNSISVILSVTSLMTNIPDFIPPNKAMGNSTMFTFVAKENSSVLCIGGFGEQSNASAFLYVQGKKCRLALPTKHILIPS